MQKHKKLLVIGLIILICIAGIAFWYMAIRNKNTNQNTVSHTPVSNTASNSGIIDNQGHTSVPNTNPAKSSSAAIILDSPVEGSKIVNGTIISGEATVSAVNYRIKDDARGVIGQGVLDVVNGKFSGTLSVHAYGSSGTFEVYSTNPATGSEENNIKIQVTY